MLNVKTIQTRSSNVRSQRLTELDKWDAQGRLGWMMSRRIRKVLERIHRRGTNATQNTRIIMSRTDKEMIRQCEDLFMNHLVQLCRITYNIIKSYIM